MTPINSENIHDARAHARLKLNAIKKILNRNDVKRRWRQIKIQKLKPNRGLRTSLPRSVVGCTRDVKSIAKKTRDTAPHFGRQDIFVV